MSPVKLRLLRNDTPPDLDEQMTRVSRGDQQAFSAVYEELSPLVYGLVLRVLRDPAMAEEVAQEVFVDLWKQAPRFDRTQGSARGWASTIAHRKAVDRVRSEQARRDREERDHQSSFQPETDSVSETVERASDKATVTEALDSLTDLQREAVTFAYFGGHTYREVAALLDVPEGTIKTRIRDGLGRLRDSIGTTS